MKILLLCISFLCIVTTQTEILRVSYYGKEHHGRKTASGEIFDMNKLTAAHKKLPFGTMVEITNINNDKSIIVKINDRGPYIKGRTFDLSRAAFDSIANLKKGIIRVKYKIVKDEKIY